MRKLLSGTVIPGTGEILLMKNRTSSSHQHLEPRQKSHPREVTVGTEGGAVSFLSIMRKVMITVAAVGALAFAAAGVASAETSAPAQMVPQSSEPAAQVQQGGEGQIEPLGTSECTEFIENSPFGDYEVTNPRFLICAAAAVIGTPGAAAACGVALVGTGIDPVTAGIACTLAIAPTAAPPPARQL